MVLENERISVGHVSKVLTDLFAGLAPIGAEVFDEVAWTVGLACFVADAR